MASLFSDFLTAIGVRHTEDYSDKRYAEMPFQSMFGLTNLLKEYGVASVGVKVQPEAKEGALNSFPTPFLADTPYGFAIVLNTNGGKVTYMTQSKTFTAERSEFVESWNGISLLVTADTSASEPEYMRHHIGELAKTVKLWVLWGLVVVLAGFAMWQTGLYAQWAAWLVLALDSAGLAFSWMLVQKSLGIHTAAAEAMCSALEEGGCDEIARSEASSFMGIFKWSEVGLAYFSVSITAMLLFPQTLPMLAAINVLCLPYTIWSISYQKFKAKVWCTLCVCVQATLWLLFGSYLLGGWTKEVFTMDTNSWLTLIVLCCCYGAVLLGLNRLDNFILKHIKNN